MSQPTAYLIFCKPLSIWKMEQWYYCTFLMEIITRFHFGKGLKNVSLRNFFSKHQFENDADNCCNQNDIGLLYFLNINKRQNACDGNCRCRDIDNAPGSNNYNSAHQCTDYRRCNAIHKCFDACVLCNLFKVGCGYNCKQITGKKSS